ncbi:MAG: Imidazolonepropionase [Gammaproteobacteria bacterium]|nr:Imidazolonepropionase [Gammaproteobacteria bacterium]
MLLLASMVAATLQAAQPTRLALVGGMLLDGYGGAPVHHAAVLMEGDRIVAAGPASEVEIPEGTPIIDTRGETMLPGLIEVHAHLVIVGDGDYPRWFKWLEDHKARYPLTSIMALSARQLLAAGVTSAIDLGAPLKESVEIRDQINRGTIPGPRLSVSGPWLTSEPAIFPPYCQVEVHTAAEAARATEANIRGGADVIKAHAGLNFEQYKAIVEVAHRYKIKVHAHLYDEHAVRDAFNAGVDVLQHVGSAGTPPYSAQLVKDIAESGRPVVPTAAHRVWLFPATRDFPERLDDPELARGFPPEVWAEVHDSLRQFHTLDYFVDREQEEFFGDASLGQWIQSGAVLGMGSDNGTPLNFHKDALWREAKVFVDHGLPASRVITALTWTNARILGKEKDLGTIEPGKLADIAVVRGNPLFDIVALSQIDVVVKDGIPYRDAERMAIAARATGSPR